MPRFFIRQYTRYPILCGPAVLCGVGGFFGFANPVWHMPLLVLCLPAGCIAAAHLAENLRQAFCYGMFAGSCGFLAGLYWIAVPVHLYGGLPLLLALPCPVLLALFLGMYSGLYCLGLFFFSHSAIVTRPGGWLVYALWSGCLWALLEVLRETVLTGFPWLTLPAGLVTWPVTVQAMAFTGAAGLSGILVLCVTLLCQGSTIFSFSRLLGCAFLAGLVGHGIYTLQTPLLTTGTASACLVQGNIDQGVKWSVGYKRNTVKRYIRLTRKELTARTPDIVIWPETALPFFLQKPSPFSSLVRQTAQKHAVHILTGAPAMESVPVDESLSVSFSPVNRALYNRAYLLGPSGKTVGFYDKQHLVPFGEYVPLGALLNFLGPLVEGVGNYRPGTHAAPLQAGDMAMGVLICYEAIFSGLAQVRVAQGANVLVNISNDAWFGKTFAPWQHLHMAALRAVEQRRALVRGTNTGVSALIDPYGRIAVHSQLYRAESVWLPAIPLIEELSFYHRYRSSLGIALCLCLTGLFALGCVRRRALTEENTAEQAARFIR